MTLGKRRWNKASPEKPNWPLQSFFCLFVLMQDFAMEGIITLKGIADIQNNSHSLKSVKLKQQYQKYKTKNRLTWQEITLQWVKSLGDFFRCHYTTWSFQYFLCQVSTDLCYPACMTTARTDMKDSGVLYHRLREKVAVAIYFLGHKV